jgi:hypothetical protein
MKNACAALMIFALSGFVTEAMAWGGDGHRTVAAIALKLLPPEKAAVLTLGLTK